MPPWKALVCISRYLVGADVIHGYRATFPIPLAESCSWNPELLERASAAAAAEAATKNINLIYAPMVDISRDPRWGRIAEKVPEKTLSWVEP